MLQRAVRQRRRSGPAEGSAIRSEDEFELDAPRVQARLAPRFVVGVAPVRRQTTEASVALGWLAAVHPEDRARVDGANAFRWAIAVYANLAASPCNHARKASTGGRRAWRLG